MMRFTCRPYRDKDDTSSDGETFYVRAENSDDATGMAKAEAAAQGYENVYVEDSASFKIYEGAAGDAE